MLLGSHLSIAGGLHNALVRAAGYGFEAMAMFVRNQRQWRASPLSEQDVAVFRRTRQELKIGPIVAHGSYLLNLAGSEEVRGKSIEAMVEDFGRCRRLGVEYLVIHPGSNAVMEEGVRRIVDGLAAVLAACGRGRAKILLETTAGGGGSIGGRFENIAGVLRRLGSPRVGVCLDTCHVFAAGYEIRTREAYDDLWRRFDEAIGLENLRAIHLNDSKGEFGSHWDRHEHIGHGKIGLEPFRWLANDERFAGIPMILETPKDLDEQGRDWDEVNAEVMRGMVEEDKARE